MSLENKSSTAIDNQIHSSSGGEREKAFHHHIRRKKSFFECPALHKRNQRGSGETA